MTPTSIALGRARWSRDHSPYHHDGHERHPPICLRVSNLDASRRFYSDLLGFVPAPAAEWGWGGYSDSRLVLVSPLLANGYRSIVLTLYPEPNAATGFLLELETSSELLDRYLLARLLHAPTSPLLQRGRCLSTSIQDPDGHRIELRAGRPSPTPTQRDEPHEESRWDRHPEDPSEERSGAFRR